MVATLVVYATFGTIPIGYIGNLNTLLRMYIILILAFIMFFARLNDLTKLL